MIAQTLLPSTVQLRAAPCSNAWHAKRRFARHTSAQFDGPIAQPDAVSQSRWAPLLSSPVDLLTLGPRAVLGAILLAPQPDALLEEANKLMQSPNLAPQAAQDALLACIERGATAESEVVQLVASVLPEEVRAVLPGSSATSSPRSGDLSNNDGESASSRASDVPATATERSEDKAAAVELESLRLAVAAVQNAVENVRQDSDPAMRSLLMLGVREARDSLSRQLAQVSKATYAAKDVPTTSAADEATRLLIDLDDLLA